MAARISVGRTIADGVEVQIVSIRHNYISIGFLHHHKPMSTVQRSPIQYHDTRGRPPFRTG